MASVESSSSERIIMNESKSDFISAVPNDVLLQIFMRLPNVRFVIRCSSVCKRWSSLISNLPSHFIRSFIQYHKGKMSPSDSLPYTLLLFLFDDKLFYQLFSKGSKILHRRINAWSDSSRYLDFLPWPRVHVRASFDDLLLVTPSIYDPRPFQYCICNPLTRKWLILPLEAPPMSHQPYTKHGLACKSNYNSNDDHENDDDNNNIRYKVVRLDTDDGSISAVDGSYVVPFTIFCSESGQWSKTTLFVLSPSAPSNFTHLSEPIGTSNGMLHFPLLDLRSFTGSILAFDPFDDTASTADPKRCRFINGPTGFARRGRSHFGVVKGQLRLWQCSMSGAGGFGFPLKIWELRYEHQDGSDGPSAASWQMLYDGKVETAVAQGMTVAGFDPDNGGVVFTTNRSGGIYKYKIEEEEREQVGKISPESLSKGVKERYSNYMRSFTLVHPIWPTPIPALPIP